MPGHLNLPFSGMCIQYLFLPIYNLFKGTIKQKELYNTFPIAGKTKIYNKNTFKNI